MMSSKLVLSIVLGLSTLGAQAADSFFTDFGTAGQANGPLLAGALGTFASGSLSAGDATLTVPTAGDAVARLNNSTFLTLDFNLTGLANLITVSFYASSGNAVSAGTANVSIDGGVAASQAITASNVANPGPGGTFITKSFVGSFASGMHSLRIDNDPTSGFRLDAVTVTAVPEPGTYAMLLAGLAAVGFVAKRRSV